VAGVGDFFFAATEHQKFSSRCNDRKTLIKSLLLINQTNLLIMLRYAIIFFVVALIAGVLGFGGIAGASAGIAQIIFYIFLILLVVSVISSLLKKA